MLKPSRIAMRAGLLAVVLTASTAAHADFVTRSVLTRESGIGPATNKEVYNDPSPLIQTLSDPPWGWAASYGQAGYGALKARSTAEADAELYGRFSAASSSGWSDELQFNSAGLQGTAGFMTATLVYFRDFHFAGNPYGGLAMADLLVNADNFEYWFHEAFGMQPLNQCSPETPGCYIGTVARTLMGSATWLNPSTVSVTIPITFGVQDLVSVRIDTNALASYWADGGGASIFDSDASHSLYWGGITSVTDANGNAVDFDLSSASGTNYLQSFVPTALTVPEPTTHVLVLAGLSALALVKRRKTPA